MSLIKLYKGKKEDLPKQTKDGSIYVTVDEDKVYLDASYFGYRDGQAQRIFVNPNPNWNVNHKEQKKNNAKILNKPFEIQEKIQNDRSTFLIDFVSYEQDNNNIF